MGGSGKKLIGGGSRHKNKTPRPTAALGVGAAPHPSRVLTGQRYVPLRPRRQRTFTVTRVFSDGRVRAVKEDGPREAVELISSRLLAVGPDGHGRHYRFIGHRSERRYRTFACIVAIDQAHATLVLPEWHPSRLVEFPARLLPAVSLGGWLTLTADLGQSRAGALNLADMQPCAPPAESCCHRPDPEALPTVTARPTPRRVELGRGCGDIVAEAPDLTAIHAPEGQTHIFLSPHVSLPAGGRVYLAEPGQHVDHFLVVMESIIGTNGTRVRCHAKPQAIGCRVAVEGTLHGGYWRWRWWPRELERHGGERQLRAYAYDPIEHCDDVPWRHLPTRYGAAELPDAAPSPTLRNEQGEAVAEMTFRFLPKHTAPDGPA
jgi:hypothetical protein